MSRLFRNHDNDARVAQLAMAAGIAQFFMAGMGSILLILAGLATWGALGGDWVKYLRIVPPAVTGCIWVGTAARCYYQKMQLEKEVPVTFRGLWWGLGILFGSGALYLVVAAIF